MGYGRAERPGDIDFTLVYAKEPRVHSLEPGFARSIIGEIKSPGAYEKEREEMFSTQRKLFDFVTQRINGQSNFLSSQDRSQPLFLSRESGPDQYVQGALTAFFFLRHQAIKDGIPLANVTADTVDKYLDSTLRSNREAGATEPGNLPDADLGTLDLYSLDQELDAVITELTEGNVDAKLGAFEVSRLLTIASLSPAVDHAQEKPPASVSDSNAKENDEEWWTE